MKKRVILVLCVLAVLLTAVICLPFARKIDTTVTAAEYRFNDPAYAVEHTVMICGHDTRNLLGYGVFEGTFAVSGFESGQEGEVRDRHEPAHRQRDDQGEPGHRPGGFPSGQSGLSR